jgi:hypothetical protein
MYETVEAQTEAWLVTLFQAGWMFQGFCSCGGSDRGLARDSIGGWLDVPRMYETVEAQTEAWLVNLPEAG